MLRQKILTPAASSDAEAQLAAPRVPSQRKQPPDCLTLRRRRPNCQHEKHNRDSADPLGGCCGSTCRAICIPASARPSATPAARRRVSGYCSVELTVDGVIWTSSVNLVPGEQCGRLLWSQCLARPLATAVAIRDARARAASATRGYRVAHVVVPWLR